jgi:hypothetical protein
MVGKHMKEGVSVPLIRLIAVLMLFAFGISVMPEAEAHPPASMTLSYDFGLQELSVTITHSVSNPSSHYVDTVTVYRNSNVVNTYPYTSQPTTGTFTYTYSVTASDGDTLSAKADCNIGGSIQRSTTVDLPDETNPTIRITSPANGSVVGQSSITVTGTASDNKELDLVQVRTGTEEWINADGTTSWSASVTLLEGDNVIRARAADGSGNEAFASVIVSYDPAAGDSSPPSITISSPNQGAVLDDPSLTVSGTSSDDAGVDSVEVKLNEGDWGLAQGTVSWTYELLLSEGMNTIVARVTDIAGKTANATIEVTHDPDSGADTLLPSVEILLPAEGAALSTDEITVSGTASDNVGIEKVEVRVNNGMWNTAQGTVSWSLPVSLVEGTNTIEVRAEDPSGNTGEDTVSVTYVPGTVDQPPTIRILSPENGTVFSSDLVTVSGTASDDQCACRVEARIAGNNWVMASGLSSWSIMLALQPGQNVIEARVTDDSGKTALDSITVEFDEEGQTDTVPPVLDIDPVSGVVNDPSLTLTGTASDNIDLDSVEIRLNGGSWRAAQGLAVWSITLELEEGLNTLEVRVFDLEGNSVNDSITVTYEPPYDPGTLDGIIEDGEYPYNASFDQGRFRIFWDINGDTLELGMTARASGWLSLGISPTIRMKDEDMIIGWVDDSDRVFVFDAYSTGEIGPHPPDTELGGTDDIIEFGGTQTGDRTTIEITRKVNSTDLYDKNFRSVDTLDVIWGYSESDMFDDYHSARGSGEIIVRPQEVEDEEEEDDVEGPPVIFIVVIVVLLVIVLAAVAVFTQSKRRKEADRMEEELNSTERENARKLQ